MTKHVVMFSGGIGSWATAKRVAAKYGAENVILLFSDVKGDTDNPHIGEDEDTYRFVEEAAANIGAELVTVVDGRNIWEVFRDRKFLGNSRLAPCSHELKQKPAKKWIHDNTTPGDAVIYVGIDWSEAHRMAAVHKGYAPWLVDSPLLEEPHLTKQQMIDWAESEGLKAPRLYEYGFKHNNCGGGCVRAGQAQFKQLLDVMPERFAEWEHQEEKMQDYLGVEVTILSRTVNGKKRPFSLTELREAAESQPSLIDMKDEGVACNCTSSWFAK
jgi:argininosuccinate synthase